MGDVGMQRAVAALVMFQGIAPGLADAEVAGPPSVGAKVGEMAVDFLLPTLEGQWGRLSDFRGRKILLIHFASW